MQEKYEAALKVFVNGVEVSTVYPKTTSVYFEPTSVYSESTPSQLKGEKTTNHSVLQIHTDNRKIPKFSVKL